jgi:uncharacterized protein YdbL (DUF1318 family)
VEEQDGIIFARQNWLCACLVTSCASTRDRCTCSSSLDNKFENCTDETPSGRLCTTDTQTHTSSRIVAKENHMRTAAFDKVCQVTDIPFATLTYVARDSLCQSKSGQYERHR